MERRRVHIHPVPEDLSTEVDVERNDVYAVSPD
jgi:hypothetical protein